MRWNLDNPVFEIINKAVILFVLSILWLLSCMPIVTIGAANSALYYAVVKTMRWKKGYATKTFMKGLKENLKKGTIINVILLLFTIMMIFVDAPMMNILFSTGEIENKFLLIMFVIKALILLAYICWIYPLLSRFDEKLIKLAQSVLYIMVRFLPRTILAMVVMVAACIIMALNWLSALIVPGITTLILSYILEPVLEKLYPENYCIEE